MKNSEFNKIISNRIIYLRKEKGLTQEQLAYQSGIAKGGLSEIERGLKEPMPLTLLKICVGLEISLKEFYDFKEITDFADKL